MEDRRRDSGSPPPALISNPPESFQAAAEPATTRRRKRKKGNNVTIISNSTPSKRLAKEKASIAISLMHIGPYTRAAAASASPAAVSKLSLAETVSLSGEVVDAADEGCFGSKEWLADALEAGAEAAFEAIKSRDANVHVVPTHCGWFSWTKVHPLEEQMLPSFYAKKSEDRTPDIYLEIRNWIMKKYHANPNAQIEVKDLLELITGDLDARQEVMEFLDHWGLINFHPFPPTKSLSSNADDDNTVNGHSLVENLYLFETVHSNPQAFQRTIFAKPAASSTLFLEPSIAEDLTKPEPSVEYHCNSCSADCSLKRYHCQTKADYDLCTECFVNEKFGSTMLSTDFILMEPAQVLGAKGGNWTDQETLLLLEALELYKENWNEIAEHVSTKTKAQCILHFVQMPIEDTFLEGNVEADDCDIKENPGPISTNGDTFVPKDTEATMESKDDPKEDQPSASLMETSKPEYADGIKLNQEKGENCAVKALRGAFEAVGSLLPPGGPIKFVEAGNPVMALAAFLSRLVEPNIITASSRCSVKSLSGSSSSMMIASRHCFVLDPPDERKESFGSKSSVADSAKPNSKKDENQKVEKSVVVPSKQPSLHNVEDSTQDRKDPDNRTEKGAATKELDLMVSHREVNHNNLNESQKNPTPTVELPEDQTPSAVKESDDLVSKEELVTMSTKESGGESSVRESSQPTGVPSDAGNDQAKECSTENNDSTETKGGCCQLDNVKCAAVTALSAAAVKAKLLADQEEDQVRQLATLLIDKQLHKLEIKLGCFSEMDSVVMRVREQLERSRQKLYQERAQIIAARLGLPTSSPRPMAHSLPTNRPAMNFANLNPRPSMNMTPQRPLTSRPMMSFTPPSNPFASTTSVGGSIRPSNQEKLFPMGMK